MEKHTYQMQIDTNKSYKGTRDGTNREWDFTGGRISDGFVYLFPSEYIFKKGDFKDSFL